MKAKKKLKKSPARKLMIPSKAHVTDGGDQNADGEAKLRGIVEAIRKEQARSDIDAAKRQYRVGQLVHEVQDDPKKFGHDSDETAVVFVAKELRAGKDSLYNAARVARFWSPEEFNRWLNRKGKDGVRLSFALFVEVVKLDDPNARDTMLERALADKLSTRAVRRIVGGDTAKPTRSRASILRKLVAASERVYGQLTTLSAWVSRIPDAGGAAEATQLDRVAELHHTMSELLKGSCAALHKKREQIATKTPPKVEVVVEVIPPVDHVLGASNPDPGQKLLMARLQS
ncbi:MAG: hypothetical protein QM723_27570 [Myxococcaceae bacterium]